MFCRICRKIHAAEIQQREVWCWTVSLKNAESEYEAVEGAEIRDKDRKEQREEASVHTDTHMHPHPLKNLGCM